MLHKRKFTYDRQSEKMLKNLKEIAEFEGYMDGAKRGVCCFGNEIDA